MRVKSRLIFLIIFLVALVVIGRAVAGSFDFLLTQFWFTSGFFLLLLLSLIDQPHFSKDANIFVNATTAWVSLLLVAVGDRGGIWWTFLGLTAYLIISSYVLMWIRSQELRQERSLIQIISRVNRQIGRPEALFSALFVWGCVLQFGNNSPKLPPLFLFWALFMILNLPAFAVAIDNLFSSHAVGEAQRVGIVLNIISPQIAEAALSTDLPADIIGRSVLMKNKDGQLVATGVLVDDRVVTEHRIGRIAITQTMDGWANIGATGKGQITIELSTETVESERGFPISVVDTGTEIGKLVFHIHPNQSLESGEVLWVEIEPTKKTFYQVISAIVCQTSLPEGNQMHSVRVTAGQLGVWDSRVSHFEPITWVAPAGHLIHKVTTTIRNQYEIPPRHEIVGIIPNSDFPVHVSIEDAVTHNTAVIGVTGSGKSFLAFHLIEAMVKCGIKVMILDISRQHYLYLKDNNPFALKIAPDVEKWLEGDSPIGIHQYAADTEGYPKTTAEFVAAAFAVLSKFKLERGKDVPARLCVVLEEAHSLIPEWNQVAQQSDVSQVNRTARTILQGRKFGMGTLIITQRTANVTKTILNQCNTIFALQSFDQTGLDFLTNYMGKEYSHAISTLPPRHAILVGKASSSTRPLLFAVKDLTNRWEE